MALRNRIAEFFSAPSPNGKGESVASAVVEAPSPIEQKATATQASTAAIAASALWHAPADFVPIDNHQGTYELRDGFRGYVASVLCTAAMRWRAIKLSEAPLYVADETAEGEPWLPDHELAQLLQYPNADEEMADLLELTAYALDGTGLCIWVIDRDNANRPARLSGYNGDEFSVRPTADRIYGEFELSTSRGSKTFDAEDVIFFRFPHPTDRWRGLAPVGVVARQLGLEAKLLRAMNAGIDNAVVPGTTVHFDPNAFGQFTPEQLEEYQAKMRLAYAEAKNHGKFFGTNGEVTKHELGFKGLEGGALYREIEASVCMAFRVRPEILAMMIGLENAPWSHMQTAQRFAYDEGIIPDWRRIERAITRQLLRQVDEDVSRLVRFDTSKVRALQADKLADARRSVLLRDIATKNQRRQIAGLEPMDGDAEIWDAPPKDAAPAPTYENTEEPKRGRAPRERKAEDSRWLLFDATTRAQEFGWQLAAQARLDADREAVLELADATLRTATKDDDPFGPADPASVRDLIRQVAEHLSLEAAIGWRSSVEPLVNGSARQAVERIATETGVSFDLLQPGLLEYVEKEAAWLVTQVTDTTKQEIRDALAAGLADGDAIPALRKRIEESGAFAPSRAELIARTETTRVYNGSQLESMTTYAQESGTAVTKEWLATNDARTRDSHRAMNGEKRKIDEEFSNGLMAPGEPNCRCTLTFEVE